MDIVEYFQTETEKLGWEFSYGIKSNQNLLISTLEENKIFFLLDPVKEDEPKSEFGGSGAFEYTGMFMLAVLSNIDNVYHNQKGQEEDKGKYNKNIKPLKAELDRLRDVIDCSDYEREKWSKIEAINPLDMNIDGFIVTYKLNTVQ
jgi:hypothetical protein